MRPMAEDRHIARAMEGETRGHAEPVVPLCFFCAIFHFQLDYLMECYLYDRHFPLFLPKKSP
jgi:hypothetical protein